MVLRNVASVINAVTVMILQNNFRYSEVALFAY